MLKPETLLPPLGKPTIDPATLDELRATTSPWLFAFLFLSGLGISLRLQDFPGMVAPRALALLLMFTPLFAWALQTRHYRAGMWIATGGGFLAIVVAQVAFPTSVAALALVLLVGLVGLLITKWAGLGMAAASTLALLAFAHQQILPPQPGVVVIGLLLIWGMLLLCWIAIAPLYTIAQWSWYYYVQAVDHSEAARERQAELALALADLAEANRQLEYLNRIARAAHREVEEAGRTKMEFVANVSHELRTPLNMIIGFSELLLEAPRVYHTTLPPALMADIAAIYRNGCHLQNLIDDVLDLSQIDMRRMALSKERTELPTLVAEAVEAVRFLYESKHLRLTAELPPGLPEILCDRTRIREVLLNLLSNAGRFTEQGGATVRALVEPNRVVIAVTDTGPGIGATQLAKLFEPFQQLGDSIRRNFGGSGLGLAISRAFIEMHGGNMWVESEVARGSTFFFSLPLPYELLPYGHPTELAGRYAELRARPLRVPAVNFRPRFAVVGHNQMLQRLLKRYLSEADVLALATFEEALQVYQEHPFQAMIANAETLEQAAVFVAQRQTLPPHVPLILATFSAASGNAQLLNVTDYLIKPITRQKLLAALQALPPPVQTILVADDDPDVPQLFDRMLAMAPDHNYRLLQAANGHEALYLLRNRRPDVLLLDLAMPGLDGYEVLREKSADPTICDIPVLVISARDLLEEPLTSAALIATGKTGIAVSKVLEAIAPLSELLGLAPGPAVLAPPEMPRG